MEITNSLQTGYIQRDTVDTLKGASLQSGKPLQEPAAGKGKSDVLELNAQGAGKTLQTPEQITIEKPRSWTIAIETIESRINAINEALKAADEKDLSFGERLTFLKEQGERWVSEIREKDPEMFVQWLKSNKEDIENGRPELASLSSDFTMKDYYSFVGKPFSKLV